VSKKCIKVVYISGPITNGMRHPKRKAMLKHVLRAIGVGITMIKSGLAPIIPHLDWLFGWHKRGKTITWEKFLNWDLMVINNCDAVYRLPGKSTGADIEVRYAKKQRKPVFYNIKSILKYNELKEVK